MNALKRMSDDNVVQLVSERPPLGLGTENLIDTEIANARRLARRHGGDIRYTVEAGWLVWDGRRWCMDEKDLSIQALAKETALAIFDEIKNAPDRDRMMKHAKRSQDRRAVDNMVALARSEQGIPMSLTACDADPWLLNLLNGTLDLRTGQLNSHCREDLITKLVPIQYEAGAKCDRWHKFLWRIMGGKEELCGYLQRMVGYVLTGSTAEQVLHFLYGLGANGKSVFCEIVRALLGDYSVVCSPELIMLRRHGGIPNDVARLRGSRVALMNETAQGSKFNEAKLKDLTGSDALNARYLHKEFFDFDPTHKLIIRGNHKPAIHGTDEGIWRRLRLVPFTVSIPKEEQDSQLLHKLRDELPGILNWAVQGCLEWQQDGLKPPAVVTQAVDQYREESDTLARFIDERCIRRNLAQVKSSEFFAHYKKFCEESGERCITSKELPNEMQRRGFERKRTNTGAVFLGIEISREG